MMTDPIADMLTRIRNASQVRKANVELPYSKMKKALADIFVREGYLEKVSEVKEGKPYLILTLKYSDKIPVINHIQRISTPGHRRYVKSKDISKVLNGNGISIFSTPAGILTGKQARQKGLGGELICEIW